MTISVEVPVVTLDVIATTTNGDIIPGLKKENFRILEDGVPQSITNFAPSEAPITMVVLMEFDSVFGGWFSGQAKYWADALFPNLNQKDWIALVTYDMQPRMEVDFTQNKEEVRQAIYRLYFPGFSESNLFDAVAGYCRPIERREGQEIDSDLRQRDRYVFKAHPRPDNEAVAPDGCDDFCRRRGQTDHQLSGDASRARRHGQAEFSASGKSVEDLCAR